jgi:phosphatidylglycerophosphate synthase
VSVLAIAVAAGGCATMIWWRTWLGLIVAGLLLQLAYVVDCVDGQLARVKSMASPVGALLDFMLDEVKAFMVIASAAARLYLQTQDARWLLLGLGGLFVAATGITLTTFVRRPEYLEATGAPPLLPATERGDHAPKSLSPVALVEALGKYVLHYPSWFLFVCAFNRLDIFLFAYLGAHLLYLGRASLGILMKLGRTRRA